MSDTFGAEDDTTATGGLQHDMPSLGGGQPMPKAMPPSPLAALARLFTGGPAPRPAQPGRSPYEYPGQSQFQPPEPNAPRWSGTTASMLLPKGSPQPPLRFTPYQRSQPTRSPDQWGQPEDYPLLPRSFETGPLYQTLSQFFGQNGSGLSQPFALAMGQHSLAYLKGAMAGQEFRAKMERQQMLDNALKLQVTEQEQHMKYGELVGKYEALDPAMGKPIDGVGLRDAWHNEALQLHDRNMVDLIESGAKVQDLINYQKIRDANLRDLTNANTKAAEQNEDDSAWTGGKQIAGEGGGGLKAPFEGPTTAPFEQTAAAAPAPADAGGVSPETGAPAAAAGQPLPSEGTPEDALVTATARTGAFPAELAKTHPKLASDVWTKAYKQLNQLENIAKSGSSIPVSQLATRGADGRWTPTDALTSINPAIVGDLMRVLNYDSPLGGGQGGQGAAPGAKSGGYSDLLGDLAKRIDPEWSQGGYKLQYDFQNDKTRQNALIRTNSIAVTGQQLLDDLDMWAKDHPNEKGVNIQMMAARALQNDPVAVKFMGDYKLYSQDLQQTLANGRALQGETFDLERLPAGWASIESWRAVVKGHATGARSITDGVVREWSGIGGKGLPKTLDPDKLSHLTAIERLYPPTGAFPGEHVELKDKDTGQWHDMIYTGVDANNWTNPANFIEPKDYQPRTAPWKRPTYDPNQ